MQSWVDPSRPVASAERRTSSGFLTRGVASLAMLLVCAAAIPVEAKNPFAAGRLLVAPMASVNGDESEFHLALKSHGGRSSGRLRGLDVHWVEVPPGLEKHVASRLTGNRHVRFAEVDELVSVAATVNDPQFGSEWHLTKVSAPTAWDVSTGTGITIAILDTGVDGTHPDLAAQIVPGWNFYDNTSETADTHGHGTAVAGTAAATSNNAVGVASIAGSSKIMPIRISDPTGYAYWSTVAQGLNWAADHGARVANISFVGVSSSSTVQAAAAYFRSKGGVVVVCAGNSGASSSEAPSGVMVVVAATNESDQLASFSTFGTFVDLAAPAATY